MPDFPLETRAAIVSGAVQVAEFPASVNSRFVDRINITGPAGSTCVLYVDQIGAGFQRDGSRTGSQDTAEYPNGLFVPSGQRLFLVWDLVTTPAIAVVQWRTAGF